MRSHKFVSPWRGFITLALFGLCEMFLSFQMSFTMAIVMVFFSGMALIGSLNRFFAATIGSIPNHVRGRVASYNVLAISLGFPTGSMIAGHAASSYGIAMVMRWYGLGLIAILAVAGLVIWKFDLQFEDEHDEEGHAPEVVRPVRAGR
jgi:predicted MFS family arabinose efflux permease